MVHVTVSNEQGRDVMTGQINACVA
jgi:hypothetical protein